MAGMEIYSREYTVPAEDVTMNGSLRLSAMFTLFQHIAGEDVERLGYGDVSFREKGILWMLTRMRTAIERMPRYGETVKISTWTGLSGHGLYTRHYEICDDAGRSLIRGCGIWGLVDARKRELIRENICRFVNLVTGNELPSPRHLSLPELTARAERAVPFGLCDLNGHLSNLRYPDVAESLLPMEYLREHEPVQADVDYLREVLPQEDLPLEWGREDDAWYFRGGGEENAFRMRLVYRKTAADMPAEGRVSSF